MKMILTSKGSTDEAVFLKIKQELDKPVEQIRILFIPTALYVNIKHEKLLNGLIQQGFAKDNIIFLDHIKSQKYCNLDIDVIYGCGGNTFLLLKLIKESGFDREIIRYIKTGVTYISASAGTHLVTKNIEHLIPIDGNDVGLTDFGALGLFDGIVFCHYKE